jgi:hypothetical protein
MALSRELKSAFTSWSLSPEPWPEERLSGLARRAFAIQYEGNLPYRRYCERLGVTPDDVRRWQDMPAVPTTAFREVTLVVDVGVDAPAAASVDAPAAASVDAPARTHRQDRLEFRTSGTTRGREKRGRHAVIDSELYRAALEASFRRHVLGGATAISGPPASLNLAENTERILICSLIPPFELTGDSSLAWMSDAVLVRFGAEGSCSLTGADGIRWTEARHAAETACESGELLCVLTTTLAADEWMRRLADDGVTLQLPDGSRVMDTGGAKGRQGLQRAEVVSAVEQRLGVPPELVINEFGMTELLSQRYSEPGHDGLVAPPWLRTRALDPNTLDELRPGEVGVLCHFDLANAGSVCAVLTEDLGTVRDNVVRLAGRSPGAPPRGCSLATAELLDAQQGCSE